MRIRAGYFLGRGIFLSVKPIYTVFCYTYFSWLYVRESSAMFGSRRSYSGEIVLGLGKTNNLTRNTPRYINKFPLLFF